jgi:CBS domain-containing protein
MNVESILRQKGNRVVTIAPGAHLTDAVAALRQNKVGALVVSHDGTGVEGILSERDIINSLAEHGAAALDLTVADTMSRNVITCRRGDTIADLAALMTERRIRHLPVVEDRHLVGIVSIGDVVKQRIDEVEGEATSMREFIASA